MKSHAAQVVYGPGTFLNQAVAAVNTGISSMLSGAKSASTSAAQKAYALAIGKGMGKKKALAEANAAGQLEYQQQLTQMEQLAVTSGLNSTPSIDDPQFIPQIVFDQTRGVNQPKARFAYLFPTADSALIQVRLRSTLSDAQQARAISWIRQAIRMPMFRSAYNGDYTVTGVPVVVNDLAGQITGAIAGLLIAALLVMAATLLIVFRRRGGPLGIEPGGGESSRSLRLLPLAIALAAAGITFGLLAVLGVTLTMASIAVLPILIGLAVDYGIQFQARAQEARLVAEREGRAAPTAAEAVAQAAGRAAPTIATAALATATGFLVLLLSPVPMVRGFGLLLVAGIAVALACALTVVSAALVLGERGRERAAWLRRCGAPASCSPRPRVSWHLRCVVPATSGRAAGALGRACGAGAARRGADAGSCRGGSSQRSCAVPAACSRWPACWRSPVGSPTRRPPCSPTSPSSCRRACRRCAT